MRIIEYDEKYREDFIRFNTDWIIDNFGFLEQEDIETFEGIEKYIKNGAMIFFAVEDDTALATCMSMPLHDGIWEICKLASNKNREHKGCGSAVFEAAVHWAEEHGAKRLFLQSNSRLKPALHIYEKYGFQRIEVKNYDYVRGDIAFEKQVG